MSVTAAVATPCETLRAAYKAAKAALIERFGAASNVEPLMHALARATDDALKGAWAACAMPGGATLVAVGGYGRGELAPYSDVDILVLLPESSPQTSDAELNGCVERFIGMAWDLGLDIGSSVRSVEQCIAEASNDITVQTSLLEARRICGDMPLFQRFSARYRETLDPRAFFQAKVLEMRQRHAKFQDTPYSLEPTPREAGDNMTHRPSNSDDIICGSGSPATTRSASSMRARPSACRPARPSTAAWRFSSGGQKTGGVFSARYWSMAASKRARPSSTEPVAAIAAP